MLWDELLPASIMREGEVVTYATDVGLYIEAEIVRVICPQCLEEFIGSKREAGIFISGHATFHEFIDERADYYGGI
tara:strand:+ start:768 stop:995 length:228 start_codon:yes stop_codon:yes gene_type:complete